MMAGDSKQREAMKRLGASVEPDRTRPRLVAWYKLHNEEYKVQMHVVLPGKRRWWWSDKPEFAFVVTGYACEWRYNGASPTGTAVVPGWLRSILSDLWGHRGQVAEQKGNT